MLSAYGYSNEYPIARILRDGKVYKILEGATNIMKMILAADALGIEKGQQITVASCVKAVGKQYGPQLSTRERSTRNS